MKERLGQYRKPIKYPSDRTRFFSLDFLLGGAEFNEVNNPSKPLPIDSKEDLEAKFKSGVNRTDIPRMWGHPSVDRHLAGKKFSLANDIIGFRRNKGEPL